MFVYVLGQEGILFAIMNCVSCKKQNLINKYKIIK